MSLRNEIELRRSEIRSDGYPVSIGEWISIYEKGELDIHPEFQRFFRWTDGQKSRLIESLLLGIPVPQVFVAQREDGVWDVVDGLQRLSTLFQFVGILRDEAGNVLPPLVLQATKYLPSLAGMKWEDEEDTTHSLDAASRLLIKREKIAVSIILKESDAATKYELFQRLNTGGSQLSDQELRNSILVMLNRDLYQWLKRLSEIPTFVECTALSDRAYDEQYDMELVLRFVAFRTLGNAALSGVGDVGEFLTDKARELATAGDFNQQAEEAAFRSTFDALSSALGNDAFRRYDSARRRFTGGFLVSAFEAVAIGLGFNALGDIPRGEDLRARVASLWTNPDFITNSGSGVRASTRIPRIIPLGREVLAV